MVISLYSMAVAAYCVDHPNDKFRCKTKESQDINRVLGRFTPHKSVDYSKFLDISNHNLIMRYLDRLHMISELLSGIAFRRRNDKNKEGQRDQFYQYVVAASGNMDLYQNYPFTNMKIYKDSSDGMCVLDFAIISGNLKCVDYLITTGIKLGYLSIRIAAKFNRSEIIQYLMKFSDISPIKWWQADTYANSKSLVEWAIQYRNFELIDYYINHDYNYEYARGNVIMQEAIYHKLRVSPIWLDYMVYKGKSQKEAIMSCVDNESSATVIKFMKMLKIQDVKLHDEIRDEITSSNLVFGKRWDKYIAS